MSLILKKSWNHFPRAVYAEYSAAQLHLESGRTGRDGLSSSAVIYAYPGCLIGHVSKHSESEPIERKDGIAFDDYFTLSALPRC